MLYILGLVGGGVLLGAIIGFLVGRYNPAPSVIRTIQNSTVTLVVSTFTTRLWTCVNRRATKADQHNLDEGYVRLDLERDNGFEALRLYDKGYGRLLKVGEMTYLWFDRDNAFSEFSSKGLYGMLEVWDPEMFPHQRER